MNRNANDDRAMMEGLEDRRLMSGTGSHQGMEQIMAKGLKLGTAVMEASAPVSGRITSVAVDPSDPSGNTYYVGTANGGVWK